MSNEDAITDCDCTNNSHGNYSLETGWWILVASYFWFSDVMRKKSKRNNELCRITSERETWFNPRPASSVVWLCSVRDRDRMNREWKACAHFLTSLWLVDWHDEHSRFDLLLLRLAKEHFWFTFGYRPIHAFNSMVLIVIAFGIEQHRVFIPVYHI